MSELGGGHEQFSFQFDEPEPEAPAPKQAEAAPPPLERAAEGGGRPELHERDDTGEYWTSYRNFRRTSGGGHGKLRPKKR